MSVPISQEKQTEKKNLHKSWCSTVHSWHHSSCYAKAAQKCHPDNLALKKEKKRLQRRDCKLTSIYNRSNKNENSAFYSRIRKSKIVHVSSKRVCYWAGKEMQRRQHCTSGCGAMLMQFHTHLPFLGKGDTRKSKKKKKKRQNVA